MCVYNDGEEARRGAWRRWDPRVRGWTNSTIYMSEGEGACIDSQSKTKSKGTQSSGWVCTMPATLMDADDGLVPAVGSTIQAVHTRARGCVKAGRPHTRAWLRQGRTSIHSSHPSTHPPIHPSTHRPTHLSIHPSIHSSHSTQILDCPPHWCPRYFITAT